uniref:PHD-type domain-containing protein n=1 Tax=Clastoptera arizonana TaxID=38151 RepID=A0A1B6CRC0_9HEMI
MGNPKKIHYEKLDRIQANQKCAFCRRSEINEVKLGPIYQYQNIMTHYFCMLLSSNMRQNGSDNEGILGFLIKDIRVELNRGKRLGCVYCKKNGATLGCDISRCKVAFHLPCGIEHNSLHQFFDTFKSFCHSHRPMQKIPKEISSKGIDCIICCENVSQTPGYDNLWAPCCRINAWFHRDCIQGLAISAGYFFKCPLCNNKKIFRQTMLQFGIYIPQQDAAWEAEPNAFEDLYQRHDKCNADICKWSGGRRDNTPGTRGELVLCNTCGSEGMHIGCGKLSWSNPKWECKLCKQISRRGREASEIMSNEESTSMHGQRSTGCPHTSLNGIVEDRNKQESYPQLRDYVLAEEVITISDSDGVDSDIEIVGVEEKCSNENIITVIYTSPQMSDDKKGKTSHLQTVPAIELYNTSYCPNYNSEPSGSSYEGPNPERPNHEEITPLQNIFLNLTSEQNTRVNHHLTLKEVSQETMESTASKKRKIENQSQSINSLEKVMSFQQ